MGIELSGVNKENSYVTLEQGVLALEAETNHKDVDETEGVIIRQERPCGKFMCSFNLGDDIQQKNISATFKDGILKLNAQRHKEHAPTTHRIVVQ